MPGTEKHTIVMHSSFKIGIVQTTSWLHCHNACNQATFSYIYYNNISIYADTRFYIHFTAMHHTNLHSTFQTSYV